MPLRLRDLAAHLKAHGIEVHEPKRGSHFRCTKDGFPAYQLPAHNAMKSELSDVYVRGVCRHFKIPMP